MCQFRVLIWFLLSFRVPVLAQDVSYQFRQLAIGDGLSHNQVHAIFQDRKGFMWFGTLSGLNRYDGYEFKQFKRNLQDSASLSDDFIMAVCQGPEDKLWIRTRSGMNIYNPVTESFDRHPERFLLPAGIPSDIIDVREGEEGSYWFLTESGRLYRYDELTGKSRRFIPPDSCSDMHITAFRKESSGKLWLIYDRGVFQQISGRTLKVLQSRSLSRLQQGEQGRKRDYRLFVDAEGDVWVYATNVPEGVFYYDAGKGTGFRIQRHTRRGGKFRLNNNLVNQVMQDDQGLIWLCTDHGGVNLLDKSDGSVRYLMNREGDERSLAQNSITSVYKDQDGTIWIGTFKKGISYYHENMIKFPVYKHLPGNAGSLPYDDVNRFVEDKAGNLWIGTNGGGLICFNRPQGSFTRYMHDPSDPNSLSNDVIVSLCIDHEEKLWIGTYHGGLDCLAPGDPGKFIHYRHERDNPESIGDNSIWEIFEDSRNRLWIGTLSAGLDLFDRDSGTFRHFRSGEPGSVRSDYISCFMEDREGNLWIGTVEGIDVLESKTGRFVHYGHHAGPGSLSNDHVISILEDSYGGIWVGTRDGLNRFNPENSGSPGHPGEFTHFRTGDGLPDNVILTILEDESNNLWVSTPNGISNIMLSGRKGKDAVRGFRNYDKLDGLQGREFNENAAYKTRRGELIFGGANGFNLFLPGAIRTNQAPPRVALTGFQLFNKPFSLPQAIPETEEIVLKHNQDVFSIEFAALNFLNPEKNNYAYKLEGFNNHWMTADGKNRVATYTNLDPGEYVFRVRASNDHGIWNEQGAAVKIRVLPPFWKTPLAYLVYMVAAAGILYGIRWAEMRKMKARYALRQERLQAKRMHELDMMKIRFFTNVSHEFRTPLSLILSPLDKLLKQTADPGVKKHLQLMERNARRLMNLVNQLLDFRKMEVQELKLQPREGDIVQCLKEYFQSFTDLAEKKHIHFAFRTNTGHCMAWFDHDKMERILFNLLSNAFKFTPDGGRVSLELNLDKTPPGSGMLMEIKVRDTGIGIPAGKTDRIFERFFQHELPGSMINQGSGIGLSITREFVQLHQGEITVASQPGKGSCFTVRIPLEISAGRIAGPAENGMVPVAASPAVQNELQRGVRPETPYLNGRDPARAANPAAVTRPGRMQTLLLVEDYEDFRFYLKDNLRQYFHIAEAADGDMGWSKALSVGPDLIVSDVNMPGMNGIDLCRKIKGDKRTAHIPVILLTALSSEELHIRGLETGASDYMTKPFNFEILLSKIRNILDQKEAMEKTYRKQVEAVPREPSVESADEKFVRKALQAVEKNMSDPDFSVVTLSMEMHMSRVALYKRLRSLTGKAPTEFIRFIRLKKAAALLENSQLNVSEIAYEVGFSSPKYFSRYFKAEFGVIPSGYTKIEPRANLACRQARLPDGQAGNQEPRA